jgi:hypothetical protein
VLAVEAVQLDCALLQLQLLGVLFFHPYPVRLCFFSATSALNAAAANCSFLKCTLDSGNLGYTPTRDYHCPRVVVYAT